MKNLLDVLAYMHCIIIQFAQALAIANVLVDLFYFEPLITLSALESIVAFCLHNPYLESTAPLPPFHRH